MIRKRIFTLTAIFLICLVSISSAALLQGYVTGDNVIWAWGYNKAGDWDGLSWVKLDETTEWWNPKYIYGEDDNPGELNKMYFAVLNLGGPAGFLGTLKNNSGTFTQTGTDTFISDTSNWKIVADPSFFTNNIPTINPTGLLPWETPTFYANNGQGSWAGEGALPGIDPNAQWIWTDDQNDNFAIVEGNFTVNPSTPEPASLSLLGLGLLGLIGFRKKKG